MMKTGERAVDVLEEELLHLLACILSLSKHKHVGQRYEIRRLVLAYSFFLCQYGRAVQTEEDKELALRNFEAGVDKLVRTLSCLPKPIIYESDLRKACLGYITREERERLLLFYHELCIRREENEESRR